MRRFLLLAVAGALLLAACGGSDSSLSPGEARSRALADAGQATIADLPGYVPGQANSSEAADFDKLSRGIAECRPLARYAQPPAWIGRSTSFRLGTTTVDSSTAVYATEAAAKQTLEKFRDPAIVGCLTEAYRRAIGAKNVTSLSVSPVAAVAPENGFGYLVTATGPAREGGGSVTTLAGIQGVRVGRAVTSINVNGPQDKIAEVETSLLPALAARVGRVGT